MLFKHARILRRLVLSLVAAFPLLPPVFAAPGELVLRGRVLNSAGEPLPGAEVTLFPALDGYRLQLLELSGEPLPEAAGRVGTDRFGEFALAAPEPGYWQARITAQGFVPVSCNPHFLVESEDLPPARLRTDVGAVRKIAPRPGEGPAKDPEGTAPETYLPLRSADLLPFRLYRAWSARREATWGDEAWQPWLRHGRIPPSGEIRPPAAPGEELTLRLVTASAFSPEARGETLDVHLRDSGGRPVSGVLVGLRRGPAVGISSDGGRLPIPQRYLPERATPTRDDPVRDDPARDDPPQGAAGLFEAVFPGGLRLPLDLVEEAGHLILLVPETEALQGRVSDPHGESIAGAFLYLEGHPGGFVRTDPKGRYVLPWLPHDEELTARKPGYLNASRRVEAGTKEQHLVLTPAVRVAGTVTDEDGRPVADAELSTAPERLDFQRTRRSATSDREGRFRLKPLEVGEAVRVLAFHPSFAAWDRIVEDPARLGDLEIVLRRGAALIGRVLDLEGQPVAGARGIALPALDRSTQQIDDEPLAEGVSSEEGVFRLEKLPPEERLDLLLLARGFSPKLVEGLQLPGPEEEVDAGDLELEAAALSSGRVIDPEGRPLEEVRIAIRPAGPWESYTSRLLNRLLQATPDLQTDEEGRFALPELPADTDITLHLRREGYAEKREELRLEAGANELEVVLSPGVLVSGRVVDLEGAPVARARVQLEIRRRGPDLSESRSSVSLSNEDGSFELHLEPGGTATVEASSELRISQRETLDLGSNEEPPRLVLTLGEETSIHGLLLDEVGGPASGVAINLSPGESFARQFIHTRADGTFQLAARPGTVRLEARRQDGAAAHQEVVVVAGREVEVRLVLAPPENGLRISGRLLDPEGRPLTRTQFQFEIKQLLHTGSSYGTTDSRGEFVLQAALAGGEKIQFRVEGFAHVPRTVSADELPLRDLEIRFERGAVVRGLISGLPREELRAVEVHASEGRRGQGLPYLRGSVTEDGRYVIRGLGAGSWDLRATVQRTGRSARQRVELAPGQEEVEVDLHFPAGLRLSGSLLRNGRPLREEQLYLRPLDSQEGPPADLRTDRDGRFRIEGLAPGDYEVWTPFGARQISLAGDRELVLEFRTAAVTGRVVAGTTAEPLAEVHVGLSPAGDHGPRGLGSVSGADGTFVIEGVPAGEYLLRTYKEGFIAAAEPVTATEAEGATVEISLEPGSDLSLQVLPQGGLEMPGTLFIRARDPSLGQYPWIHAAVGPDGLAATRTLPPGTYEIFCSEGIRTAATRVIVEVPGGPYPVVLEPATMLSLSLPALAAAPQPVKLRLLRDGEPFAYFDLDSVESYLPRAAVHGAVPLEALPPGLWTVEVHAADGTVWSGQARTAPGEGVHLELR